MSEFAFDVVLFDLDVTLVTGEVYWPDVARAATLRLARFLGVEQAMPTTREWMSFLGRPVAEAVEITFRHLGEAERSEAHAMFAEEMWLARGRGPDLRGGVEEALEALRARGVKLGITADGEADYLDVLVTINNCSRWIDESRRLRSSGVTDKADSIQELIEAFGTRSVVMVGCTREDRDAAWANALPYVHVPRDYESMLQGVEAEATLDGMDELVPTLERRDAVLGDVLARVEGARIVAVCGPPLAGKTLAARDLARLARAAGRRADAVEFSPVAIAGADADLDVLFVAGEALEREAIAEHCDATVWIVSDEGALVRRARRKRLGLGSIEEPAGERLARYRENAGEPGDAVVVDMTNPIAPTIC